MSVDAEPRSLLAEAERRPPDPGVLAPFSGAELSTVCSPHSYVVVYGLLEAPGDTALVQTAGGLQPLATAAARPTLHASATVVYGAFATAPSELIVRAADGHVVARESLTQRAAAEAEYCEGAVEP